MIDNASFFITQRVATALSGAAANTYFLDRWKSNSAGTSCTRVTAGSPSAEYSINVTAGSIIQFVDLVNFFGGTYTFSHAGTGTVTIQRNGVTIATRAGAGEVTFTIDAVGMTSLTIGMGTGTLIRPQLEYGSKATPFFSRSVSDELIQCQRFFVRLFSVGFNCPWTGTIGNAFSVRLFWPVQMRAVPTLIFSVAGVTAYQVSSWQVDGATAYSCRLIAFGSTTNVMSVDFGASDFIQASCEP